MLNDSEFEKYYLTLNLPLAGVTKLKKIRSSKPDRRVGAGKYNRVVFIASKKNLFSVQAESITGENIFAWECEYDPDVIEYWDQPGKIRITFHNTEGRKFTIWSVYDYLVLRKNCIEIVECKPEEKLKELSEQYPDRFVLNSDGTWRCPSGEEAAEKLGFRFVVRSSKQNNWILYDNIIYLKEYLDPDCPLPNKKLSNEISKIVQDKPGIILLDLLNMGDAEWVETVYQMISYKYLYFDMLRYRISDHSHTRIYINQEIAEAITLLPSTQGDSLFEDVTISDLSPGKRVSWNSVGYTIVNKGVSEITLVDDDGEICILQNHAFQELVSNGKISGFDLVNTNMYDESVYEILSRADETSLREANRRQAIVICKLNGLPLPPHIETKRTIRRWAAAYKEAQMLYGYGYVGLLPKHYQKGNHEPKIDEDVLKVLNEFIEDMVKDEEPIV